MPSTPGPGGSRTIVDGAKAMAMTIVDAWCDRSVLGAATEEFGARGVDRSVLD
ncbi:MAG: hypothetical protein R2705_14580 [Ilumatobacteraceae bacterium]